MLNRVIVIAVAALSAACSQLPRAELQSYRDAFDAADKAAEPMIVEYAAAERAQRVAHLQTNGGVTIGDVTYFPTFDPADALALARVGLPPGADAVRRAFDAISAYNGTLVALAENRNVAEAQAQVQQIVSDVGGIVPGAGAATAMAGAVANVVTTALKPIVEAQNRAEFRRLVLEAYEPMTGLIDLLVAHSSDQYSTTISPYLRRIEAGDGDAADLAGKINDWRQVFGDYVVLLNAVKTQLGTLREAVISPRPQPVLARAAAGSAQLRLYAESLRMSVAQLRALP